MAVIVGVSGGFAFGIGAAGFVDLVLSERLCRAVGVGGAEEALDAVVLETGGVALAVGHGGEVAILVVGVVDGDGLRRRWAAGTPLKNRRELGKKARIWA